MYLGREALGAQGVPVYATARMARFLRENGPWSQLVALGNIALREIEPGREFALTPDLKATALAVPHRDEWSDTVGYVVAGPSRVAALHPGHRQVGEVGAADSRTRSPQVAAALLDGTFYAPRSCPVAR